MTPAGPSDPVRASRRHRGATSHHAGQGAEDRVAAHYERRGHRIVARRWRGRAGEIDLVVQDGAGYVFVEVKASRSHDLAAERISPRQIARIEAAACEFVAALPDVRDGTGVDMRFDVALLDRSGQIEILENAFL